MSTPPQKHSRYAAIDATRGFAILMMFIYHFSYDLVYFKYIQQDFYHDPFWINFRVVIVSTFLFVVGVSLHIAHARQFRQRQFLRRLFVLLGCAALVSLSSYLMFPRSWIWFGILHFIAAASLLGLLFLRLYWLNLLFGILLIFAGFRLQFTVFDHPGFNWIGMMTHKPVTEDYVPILPWFGVVLLGMFFAKWAYQQHNIPLIINWQGQNPVARSLRFAGRHSLLIYMLHQPVFIGLLYLLSMLTS